MAYTNTWNSAFEASPSDIDVLSDGATKIRALKVAIEERMNKDHYWVPAGVDVDHGEHTKVSLRKQTSKPTAEADKGYVYSKIVGSHVELFYCNEAGTETQLTTLGVINLTIPVKATGAELTTGTDDAKFATAKAIKDSHNVPSVAPGASGNVLTSNGTDWTSGSHDFAGQVVQVVHAEINTYVTGTTVIPYDDTIPQISEGTLVLSLSITPKSATNKLLVQCQVNLVGSYAATAALFQGSGVNAISAIQSPIAYSTGVSVSYPLNAYVTSGTTSALSFTLRVGATSGYTWYLNGYGSRILGGANITSITISEIKV